MSIKGEAELRKWMKWGIWVQKLEHLPSNLFRLSNFSCIWNRFFYLLSLQTGCSGPFKSKFVSSVVELRNVQLIKHRRTALSGFCGQPTMLSIFSIMEGQMIPYQPDFRSICFTRRAAAAPIELIWNQDWYLKNIFMYELLNIDMQLKIQT